MQNDFRLLQERYNAMILTLPVKAGAVMVSFSKQRFREQAWADNATEPWKRRRSTGKRDAGRALLIKTGRLRRSIRVVRYGNHSVTIGSDVPYAAAHNNGFRGVLSIAAHKRKRFGKEKIDTGKLTKKGRPKKKTVIKVIGEIDVKAHERHVNIPRRRFMGSSQYLNRQLGRLIGAEVNRIFK